MRWEGVVAVVLVAVAWLGSAGALVPSPVPRAGGAQVPGQPTGRCIYQRAYGMLGAHCSELNLHNVPVTLKTSIEILDVTFNRIRDIRNTTFLRYKSLRYLYLGENMILHIEAGAFDTLTSLETLDLSMNALSTIPAFILNLPSLRKLYMADNALINLSKDLETIEKPIRAPINYLSLSNCQLTEFPDFGPMSQLESLNMSANEFRNLVPGDFTKLCGLTTLDVTGSIYARDACTYKALSVWFTEKQIKVIPDIYAIFNPDVEEGRRCPDVLFSEDDMNAYNECRAAIKSRKLDQVAKKTWIIIAGCVGSCLFLFVACLVWLHRRNVKQTENLKKKIKAETLDNNVKLLGDVS